MAAPLSDSPVESTQQTGFLASMDFLAALAATWTAKVALASVRGEAARPTPTPQIEPR